MTRLIEDGFGIGVIPPALVREQLANGSLVILNIANTQPSSLSMLSQVASWRTGSGLEHCEAIVRQAQNIVQRFCKIIGPERGIAANGEDALARHCLLNALHQRRGQEPQPLQRRDLRQQIQDQAVTEERDNHGIPRLSGQAP